MAKVLGLELGKYDITVNAISPGLIITERTVQDDPNAEANWAAVIPTRRTGRRDIAAAPEPRHRKRVISPARRWKSTADGQWSALFRSSSRQTYIFITEITQPPLRSGAL
jgi:NAD(P)-dependent dehydrogenase (short-subunit alcohol dehydrogenase family)